MAVTVNPANTFEGHMKLPTGEQLFWSVAITVGVMLALVHVVPRVPVVNALAAKAGLTKANA